MSDFTPKDNETATKFYSKEGGGCCGQSCLAIIERSKVLSIFDDWKKLGFEWKGYSPIRDLRKYLELKGYTVKLITLKNKTDWKAPFYIIRIQFLGGKLKKLRPFYGHGHWSVASAHTHFIVREGERIFCNSVGWFGVNQLGNYLTENPKGIITSVLEIKRGEC